MLRLPRLALAILALAFSADATAATKPKPLPESKDIGIAIGPLFPAGALAETNNPGLFAALRGYFFPNGSRHGVRASLWVGGTDGKTGIDNGYGYGVEMEYAARFGPGAGPFYLFVGGGLCGSEFTAIKGSFPGGVHISVVGSALSAQAGVGYTWKHVFVEASYTEVFDDTTDYGFMPVVVGVRF